MHRRATRGSVRAARATVISFLLLAAIGAVPANAQVGLSISTQYPAVSVQPGTSVSFSLQIEASTAVRVALSAQGVPDGWSATFTGGGNEIQAAYVQPDAATTVTLNVDVPAEATNGTSRITVVATGGGETVTLPLDLTAAVEAGGSVTLESDYPSLVGSTDDNFQFNLTLRNDTPQQLIFDLSATGPAGWTVTVQPSGQARAASVTVPAHGTQRLEATANPPTQTAADTYPITVQVSSGSHQATAQLGIQITGSVQMSLSSSDSRLNTTANAGGTRDFSVVVSNDGTSDLSAINLTGSGPSGWQITFDPATVDTLVAGDTATAVAHISPSADAVAGDYVVTLSAQATGTTKSIDVRVTVETPPIWGFVGVALILVAVGGMFWIFQRYGRR
jgi:uncharacterized membrane protein